MMVAPVNPWKYLNNTCQYSLSQIVVIVHIIELCLSQRLLILSTKISDLWKYREKKKLWGVSHVRCNQPCSASKKEWDNGAKLQVEELLIVDSWKICTHSPLCCAWVYIQIPEYQGIQSSCGMIDHSHHSSPKGQIKFFFDICFCTQIWQRIHFYKHFSFSALCEWL